MNEVNAKRAWSDQIKQSGDSRISGCSRDLLYQSETDTCVKENQRTFVAVKNIETKSEIRDRGEDDGSS